MRVNKRPVRRVEAAGEVVLMATHSPILAGIEGATSWQLDDAGMFSAHWEDLDVVLLQRRYLDWRASR